MRINDNGVVREMTAEEIAEHERKLAEMHPPETSEADRIAALEEELRAAKILLGLEG